MTGVIGIDQSANLVHTNGVAADATPSPGFRNAPPCSSSWGEQIPGDKPAFQGSAVHAGVAPGTFRHPESVPQDPQGWYGEETLDVEAVHTMAPGADIVYVGAPNNFQGLDAALNHVVDRRLAQIVTNSYGFSGEFLPAGFIKPYNDTLIQAAAGGIGVYFSSGDSGDEVANLGIASVDWPASRPWVTAVGGTSLGVTQSDGYLGETGWGTMRAPRAGNAWGTPVFQFGGGGTPNGSVFLAALR